MKRVAILFLLFAPLLLPGCKPRRYETAKAYVYKRIPRPIRGGGYFVQVYYVFEYKGDTIADDFKYGRRYRADLIEKGDTLVLQFPPGKPARNKIKSVIRPERKK